MNGRMIPNQGRRPDTHRVGDMLRAARHKYGWSQTRLAGRLCDESESPTVTRNDVPRWERGRRIPRRFWQQHLSTLLAIEPAALRTVAAAETASRRRARSATAHPPRQPVSGPPRPGIGNGDRGASGPTYRPRRVPVRA